MKDFDWNLTFNELGPALYRFFCASFAPAVADDCVQETFFRLIQKVKDGKFDIGLGNIRMYSYGVANFVRLEHLKMRTYLSETEHAEAVLLPTYEREIDDRRQIDILRQAIAKLPDTQQYILQLYLDKELKMEDIALLANMPIGTVKSHIHRAKEQIKMGFSNQKELENE